ncbi:MAG TPA: taurine catabolism dioxygenase TauD [Gammaproteobacteria bacterium]|nr:taurine catabolism dioxygenase TauD [Gammaproteobacteria bacterium]
MPAVTPYSQLSSAVLPAESPFDLHNSRAYAAWREQKLARFPRSLADLRVRVANLQALSEAECAAIRAACGCANMAIYTSVRPAGNGEPDASLVAAMGRQFGLRRLDQNLYADDTGISALQVSSKRRQYEYIPYSSKGISWHTDGYYNPPERKVCAMVLHCVRPAAKGGENTLLDHEMLYLQLRDQNPRYIAALMQEDVMTIPANIENGVEIRPAQSGPVFSVDAASGRLHMRYTARTRSIVWKDDADTRAAVSALEALLAGESPYVFHTRLAAGEGIISNNVLHTRTAFEDEQQAGQGRLIYRARFYDHVQ